VRGTVYRQCWCRDPETGRKLHGKCPDLKKKGHGSWYYRYEAPRAPGEKRRQPVAGPFDTKALAEDDLAAALARAGGGAAAADRALKVASWLESYQASKVNLKARTRETDAEAFRLYWVPALGHMRLAEVRKRHVEEVMREMMLINRPLPDGERQSEMLRRMTLARADDARRTLPEGESRHKKSVKPLSPARVARMFAPFRAAMNAAVPAVFTVSPCAGAELPRAAKVRPLAWTAPREAAFRRQLAKREEEAEAVKGKRLTTVEREALWADPALRPCPVMVWTPEHAGAFLDSIAAERLFALFALVIFRGLRRGEEAGLSWAEVDLDAAVVYVRETDSGSGPKSDAGTRAVSLPARVVRALRSWRAAQASERLGWGEAWTDTGLVFTHEDGGGVSGQWASRRLRTLAFRAGVPPVRFHDLRHGAASYAKAAGQDTKYISEFMGHARSSFTNDAYINLFPGIEAAMAEEAAAIVPEGGRPVGRLPLREAGGGEAGSLPRLVLHDLQPDGAEQPDFRLVGLILSWLMAIPVDARDVPPLRDGVHQCVVGDSAELAEVVKQILLPLGRVAAFRPMLRPVRGQVGNGRLAGDRECVIALGVDQAGAGA
jgi:integrase